MLPGRLTLRRWRRRLLVLVPTALGVAYFLYHAVYGEAGWQAWRAVEQERVAVAAKLAEAQSTNAALQVAIDGLTPDTLDPDAVETALRRLGYVRADERVVIER